MKEIISIKTDYSILESMIKIPCLISYAVENGINTLGIVDNNLGYVAEFVKLCNKNNIDLNVAYRLFEVSDMAFYAYDDHIEVKVNNDSIYLGGKKHE